ncbi:hypothetical protein [Candidatus Albibeggiatoa sp. nov. BB20]|uniref:hypothetical protein n=1 Tax=Candidatus Albibeggiatoa sp. nov. BB20 TaxID=3162723 RepID=UPI0033655F50
MFVLAKSERWLRIILPIFMLIVFTMTIMDSTVNYLGHHDWKMGDWLINYAGGWVRRGFLGELFIVLSKTTGINPGIYVTVFQILLYFTYFLFSYLLLRKQKSIIPFVFLIFSPFIFTFQLNDFQGGYRKEIIYFAFLSFIAWSRFSLDFQKFEKVFVLSLIVYPFVVLSHEMLFLFIPYIVLTYTFDKKINIKLIRFISILVFPSFLAFIFSVMHQGSIEHAAAIHQSLADAHYSMNKRGAIFALQYDAGYWAEKLNVFIEKKNYIYTYIISIGLSLAAFMPVRAQLQIILARWHGKALVVGSLIATVLIASIAVDWGRFIYINLVSLFILSLLAATVLPVDTTKNKLEGSCKSQSGMLVVVIFLIWALFWHIPHCCGQSMFAKRLTNLNSHLLIKPAYRLYRKLNR